jgi:hypothetical protein
MEGSEMEKPIVWQSIDIDLFAVLVLWVRPGVWYPRIRCFRVPTVFPTYRTTPSQIKAYKTLQQSVYSGWSSYMSLSDGVRTHLPTLRNPMSVSRFIFFPPSSFQSPPRVPLNVVELLRGYLE